MSARGAGGEPDVQLTRAYEACRVYAMHQSGGHGMVRDWLPAATRRHSDALVAFCMYTDQLVDDVAVTVERRALSFARWRKVLVAAQDGHPPDGDVEGSVCHAFVHTMRVHGITARSVSGHLDAVGADLSFSHFESCAELERYLDEVAGPVLAWANAVYGGVSPEADRRARLIAAADQLTDFLVDLRDDLAQGRLYLPLEDLERFDVDRAALEQAATNRHTPAGVRELVLFEAARARALFDAGSGWELLVDPSARKAAWLVAAAYRYQLDDIERSGGDIFGAPAPGAEVSAAGRRAALESAISDGRQLPQPDHAASGAPGGTRARASVPRHLGIIMDGNRRWAREQHLSTAAGYIRGADVLCARTIECIDRGVEFVSAYMFSTENWNRPPREINDLMDVFGVFVREQLEVLHQHNVRVRILGRLLGMPNFVRAKIQAAQQRTEGNDGGMFIMCLNYGGQTEIADAVTALLSSGMSSVDVSPLTLSDFLYEPDIPPIDLVVRTGGEQRLSNFMLWRAAYAELAFVSKLWPTFTTADLLGVLDDYANRERRFGQ